MNPAHWFRKPSASAPPPNTSQAIAANKAAYNETAPIHEQLRYRGWVETLSSPDGHLIPPKLAALLLEHGLAGKDAAILACNNGRHVLSLRRLGARRATGFDLSDACIAQGRRLAEECGIEAELVVSNTYDIPQDYNTSFDFVLITAGSIALHPDWPGMLAVVKRLLRAQGLLIVREMHPFLQMLDPFDDHRKLRLCRPYFAQGPLEETRGLDYFSRKPRTSLPYYYYPRSLGELLQGTIDAGLEMLHFSESPGDVSSAYRDCQKHPAQPPLSWTGVFRKRA